MEARLQKIRARYPQIAEFYDLELQDGAAGPAFSWQQKGLLLHLHARADGRSCRTSIRPILSEQGEEEYCENCGRPMVLKKGRFGTFFACTGYPDCKTTKQIGGTQKKPDQPLDEKCPTCGSDLVLKSGRFGEFTACSNYPTCKYVKQKTIGVKCPECSEGEVVERRSRKGKTFYGCNRYPDCKFVAWGKPVPEKCPECGNSVHDREVAEGGSGVAVPERGVQAQAARAAACRGVGSLRRAAGPGAVHTIFSNPAARSSPSETSAETDRPASSDRSYNRRPAVARDRAPASTGRTPRSHARRPKREQPLDHHFAETGARRIQQHQLRVFCRVVRNSSAVFCSHFRFVSPARSPLCWRSRTRRRPIPPP